MSSFLQDLRYGVRTLARSPGFAAMAIVTLALGIGATTAMFSVVDGVLLKPLRYRDADRIVAVSTVFTNRGRAIPRMTGGDYMDVRADRDAFVSIASYYGGEMGVQVASRAEFVGAMLTTTDFMNVFAVAPLYGRLFDADDAQRSAIVSLPFAVRNFGSGDRAIGQPLHLDDRTYTIVGVVPPAFQFPERTDVWVASARDPGNVNRTSYNAESMQWMTIVGVVGNVRQDSPASEASPALYMPLAQHPFRANEVQVAIRTGIHPSSVMAPVEQIVREMNSEVATRFTTMDAMVSGSIAAPRFRTTLAISFAALALLLAIMGVYAVMSYVTVQRGGEFAIRAALGASPAAIRRMVLLGAARLAAVGVLAGAALAVAASRALATMLFGLKGTDTITYAIVVAVVLPAVLLAALLPAWRASRVDPLVALRDE